VVALVVSVVLDHSFAKCHEFFQLSLIAVDA